MKFFLIFPFILFSIQGAKSQLKSDSLKTDSSKLLNQVTVRGYLRQQPVLSIPASIGVVSQAQLALQPDNSFISVLNTVAGVRAEERSPGSYRLSIRGSLLRSPFGVRDVKVYLDEIPLTDAGGNTYLNAIDYNGINSMEVLKGPDGSLFGANSGGVVILNTLNQRNNNNFISIGLNGGTYGLLHESTRLQESIKNYSLNLAQAYESYGGYREHSYMQRNYLQAVNRWAFKNDDLRITSLFSNLGYETPGGLTLSQFQTNPQWARPPTKTIPGAIQQKAGVYQKVFLTGFTNEYHFNKNLRNVLSVFGTYVDFTNPFITNYGQRYESTFGLRTYFELSSFSSLNFNTKFNLGIEWQQTNSIINNYGNKLGARDTAQTFDKINTRQHFIFARYIASIFKKLNIEAALSLNFYNYEFKNIYPNDELNYNNRNFTPQLMPRVAVSYQISQNTYWRSSISRGYSTPTTSEIRPTDHTINPNLSAQYGVNYESGFRLRNSDESIYLDVSVFYYHLQNAIVPRFNADGTQYYINAGATNQPGLELTFMGWIIHQNNSSFIRGLQINESITIDRFKFADNYHDATTNYSGNQLTGVPGQVIISSLQTKLPNSFYLFIEHNYTAKIPLNDANIAFAPAYNILQLKSGWKHNLTSKSHYEIYGGINNALNQKYSLGNDLNAVGGRYYNAAPLRNYYLGFTIIL